MSEQRISDRDTGDIVDALGDCLEARREEREARERGGEPREWDYFGRSYIDACDRADARLAEVLSETLERGLRARALADAVRHG